MAQGATTPGKTVVRFVEVNAARGIVLIQVGSAVGGDMTKSAINAVWAFAMSVMAGSGPAATG